ncbi:MAG: hypothetical protein OJF61_002385 [Rhodanobacteraceae bacterium]|nr:MAG: hypothetical protein OJF61_002385 [Rhodanobacteraceae bacterium]
MRGEKAGFGQRSPAMTHFRDVVACGAFAVRHASRWERTFDVSGARVWVARMRATSSCKNADMIINLAA